MRYLDQITTCTSYTTLSSGMPWNIPLVTCTLLVYTLALYAWHTMGRFDGVPSNIQRLSCILTWYNYGFETVVSILFSNTRTRLLYNE